MVDLMVSEQQSGTAGKGVPAGFKLTEVGVIPEDWDVYSLGELSISIASGKTNTQSNGEYPLYGSTGLIGTCKSGEYEGNALLIARVGANAGRLNFVTGEYGVSDNTLIVKIKPQYNISLFYYILLQKNINSLIFGSGQPLITGSLLKKIIIAVPREDEQNSIANVLIEIDTLIIKLEKLLSKKQAIKTATMQQLLTGKTRLPQFALRDDGVAKGYKKSELGDIPEDWDISTYGQVFSFLSTSTNARSDLSDTGEYGYIHYGDIHTKWNNNLNLENSSVPRISSDLVSSSFIEDGDLIMADASEDYAGIGKSIEIQGVSDNIIVAGLHTYLLRDVNNIFVDGFRGYLHCIRAVKANIDRLATGMKVFGVSKNNLKTIPIPVPPKEEQTAIAAILSDMDKDIQTLQQRLDKTRQLKQGMMQELLTGKTRLI